MIPNDLIGEPLALFSLLLLQSVSQGKQVRSTKQTKEGRKERRRKDKESEQWS